MPSHFRAFGNGWFDVFISVQLIFQDRVVHFQGGGSLPVDVVDECTVCGDGGTIFECSFCPLSFHARCMRLPRVPEGDWKCPRCVSCADQLEKLIERQSEHPVVWISRPVKGRDTITPALIMAKKEQFVLIPFGRPSSNFQDQAESSYGMFDATDFDSTIERVQGALCSRKCRQ